MGILVSIAIVWAAFVTAVIVTYTLGPPVRRLWGVRAAVQQQAEEKRGEAVRVRERLLQQAQDLDCSVDEAAAKYQEDRRKILSLASDHHWGEKELARWIRQEEADQTRTLRVRNLFSLVAWNLVLSVVFGLAAWSYYQHVQSKVRPQIKVPSGFHQPQP